MADKYSYREWLVVIAVLCALAALGLWMHARRVHSRLEQPESEPGIAAATPVTPRAGPHSSTTSTSSTQSTQSTAAAAAATPTNFLPIRVYGRVIEEATWQPVAGVCVQCTVEGEQPESLEKATTRDGEFEFTVGVTDKNTRCTLLVEEQKYVSPRLNVDLQYASREQVLLVRPAAMIEGVVHTRDGDPVAGEARVRDGESVEVEL